MVRAILLFLIVIIGINQGKSQGDLYFGLAFGSKGDLYNYYDPSNQLSTKPIYNGLNFHFKLEYILSHRISGSTGVIFNNYGERYKISDIDDFQVGTFDAFFGWEVPIRGHVTLTPWKANDQPFKIGITLGYHLQYISNYQSIRTTNRGFGGGIPDIIINTITTIKNERFYNLAEGGIFFNATPHPRWLLGLSVGKVVGFKNILMSHIDYSTNKGSSFESAFARTKGDYVFLHFEAKYRLNRLPMD